MAKSLFLYVLKHYLFWLVLFAFGRTIFLLWNIEELNGISFGHILKSYISGLYVDTAMSSYLLILPFLFVVFGVLTQKTLFLRVNNYVHAILFFAFFLLTFSELPIYDEWHTKLNYKALWFFGNPSEVFHTASTVQLISCLGASIVCTLITHWFYRKKISALNAGMKRDWSLLIFSVVTPALIIIAMRGGFQTIPIQLSDAYYSQHNILNLASLNSSFNLASSCIENFKGDEPYQFMPEKDARRIFSQLHEHSDSATTVLTTTRPNIVLVVLEGWSADMISSYDGMDGIAPNFDLLSKEGISFTRCYASGSLSDQGMAAVFSAFPAQPHTSIITQPNKYVQLPCINKELRKVGYHTSFMFGGQLSYGNIRSYMYFNEFDKIIEGDDFNVDAPEGKLGYHDEFLFARQLQELKSEQQPFFAAMFTLSTHGPFDFPIRKDLNIGDKEEDYVNSIYYADSCIGDFIRKAKQEPWYNNTLFVFVSDHSHNTPKNYSFNAPGYRRIPMLFYGNVIDSLYRGFKYTNVSSQTDLAATLLQQLQLNHDAFRYSKDLFNPTFRHFAYYSFDEGFGYVNDEASIVWSVDRRGEYRLTSPGNTSGANGPMTSDSLTILREGQSILQMLSLDYWEY